jgi:hypothetical protein
MLAKWHVIDSHFVTVNCGNTIVHSFSYEVWPSLGNTTAYHNSSWGQPSAKAFSCCLAVIQYVFILSSSVQWSVVTSHHLANVSLAWATSLGCKMYLFCSVLCDLTGAGRKRHTVSQPQTSHSLV